MEDEHFGKQDLPSSSPSPSCASVNAIARLSSSGSIAAAVDSDPSRATIVTCSDLRPNRGDGEAGGEA